MGSTLSDEMIQASDLAGGHTMNSSREDQESTAEAKTTESSRAEAFDKWLCWNPGGQCTRARNPGAIDA